MSKRDRAVGEPASQHPSLALAVAGLVLATSLYTTMTRAQGPGDPGAPGVPGQGPVGPGQGPGGFGPGRGGVQGGPGRFGGMPFVMGQITGGDAANGTIQVNSQFGGAQVIRVNNNTQMVTQKTVDVSALHENDQIQVQGIPTAITASSITAGQLPESLRMGGPGAFGPGGPGGFGQRGNQAQGGAARGQQQASASAMGKVTSTSPLTIQVSDGVSVVLKLGAGAKVTQIQKIAFTNLKVGDTIMAAGQAANDGTFTATGIGVNVTNAGGFGPGGFGPGGFGGRGGFGPGTQGGPGRPQAPDGPGGPPPGQ